MTTTGSLEQLQKRRSSKSSQPTASAPPVTVTNSASQRKRRSVRRPSLISIANEGGNSTTGALGKLTVKPSAAREKSDQNSVEGLPEILPTSATQGSASGTWMNQCLGTIFALIRNVAQWLQTKRRAHTAAKRLRLCETAALGEKRSVSILRVDGQDFLIGVSPSSIALLAQLTTEAFTDVLHHQQNPGKDEACPSGSHRG